MAGIFYCLLRSSWYFQRGISFGEGRIELRNWRITQSHASADPASCVPDDFAVLLPIMLIATATSGTVIWQYEFHNAGAWSAFAFSGAVLFITFVVDVPVSKEILAWSPDAPINWRWHIARWNFVNVLRLAISLAALLCIEIS